MIQEAHIFVTGKVQGVGFRSTVRKKAVIHQIRGYVRNLPDGRVEICAQGNEEQIDAFLSAVEAGPGLGSISRIEKTLKPLGRAFSSFEIL